MWEIWANKLLPKTLKCGPKSNKSPNLVTLMTSYVAVPTKYTPEAVYERTFSEYLLLY